MQGVVSHIGMSVILGASICPDTSVHPHTSIHLYICMSLLHSMFLIYHGNIGGHLCTPYAHMSWGLLMGICTLAHLSDVSLSVHPFASQFITFMPVAPHYCESLLYCIECLQMYAQYHAVDLFFSL